MKRRYGVVVFAMAVAAVSGLAACGGDDGGGGDDQVRVGVTLAAFNDPWLDAVRQGTEEAAESLGDEVELELVAGRDLLDVADQIAKTEDLLATNLDALVVQTNGPEEMEPVLQRAIDDGVKVVIIDNDIPGLEGQTATVRSANEELGRLAGEMIIEDLGGKGELGLVVGAPGITSLEDREKGLRDALADSDIGIVGENPTDCGQEKGVTAMEDLITANPELDAAIAMCGQAGVGAVQAMGNAGLGNGSDMFLYTMDAQPDEAKAILAGDIEASFAELPVTFGELGVETAVAAVEGEKVEAEASPPTDVVTKDNAKKYLEFR